MREQDFLNVRWCRGGTSHILDPNFRRSYSVKIKLHTCSACKSPSFATVKRILHRIANVCQPTRCLIPNGSRCRGKRQICSCYLARSSIIKSSNIKHAHVCFVAVHQKHTSSVECHARPRGGVITIYQAANVVISQSVIGGDCHCKGTSFIAFCRKIVVPEECNITCSRQGHYRVGCTWGLDGGFGGLRPSQAPVGGNGLINDTFLTGAQGEQYIAVLQLCYRGFKCRMGKC